MSLSPIGIFDSGLGGLSVWREVVKQIQNRSIIYFSDNAWCPYGPRPAEELVDRTEKITRFLIREGCGIIVIACNTATAAAIDHLRKTFTLPFVGMEPAVKPAALHSKSGVVGILATQGTFLGRLYQETSQRFATQVKIIEKVGNGLVELIEQGQTNSPQTLHLLRTYINPMIEEGADHLVLGCTHYPFLIPAIQSITQDRLLIIDPAPAVALHLRTLLANQTASPPSPPSPPSSSLLPHPLFHFYATGPINALESSLQSISPLLANVQFIPFFEFP